MEKQKTLRLIIWFFGLIILLFMNSCRTVDKAFLEENYLEKQAFEQYTQDANLILKDEVKKNNKDIFLEVEEILKQTKTNTLETDNENTAVIGTIEAEEGVEKSAIIGSTTITSNGANIQFQIKTTKELLKESETNYHELLQSFESQSEEITTLKASQLEQNTKIDNLQSQIETFKESNSRTVTKKQLGFGLIVFLVVVVLVYLVYRYARSKLSWFV